MEITDDLPVAEGHISLGKGGDILLMRHDDDGNPQAVQLLEDTHHLQAGPGIEVPSRFICQDHHRVIDQCTGNSYPLLLTVSDLTGKILLTVPLSSQEKYTIVPLNWSHQKLEWEAGTM